MLVILRKPDLLVRRTQSTRPMSGVKFTFSGHRQSAQWRAMSGLCCEDTGSACFAPWGPCRATWSLPPPLSWRGCVHGTSARDDLEHVLRCSLCRCLAWGVGGIHRGLCAIASSDTRRLLAGLVLGPLLFVLVADDFRPSNGEQGVAANGRQRPVQNHVLSRPWQDSSFALISSSFQFSNSLFRIPSFFCLRFIFTSFCLNFNPFFKDKDRRLINI